MSVEREYKGCSLLSDINDYTVIDLETTGRNIKDCEIIELAAVKVRNGEIVDTFSSLVQPSESVPAEITVLTGICDEMLVNAPRIDQVIEEYIDFIGNDIVLGHNIQTFDSNIIYDLCEGFGLDPFANNMLDTLKYSKHCRIDVPNRRLSTLSTYFGITHDNAHRALSDCIANHEVYQRLKDFFDRDYFSESSGRRHNFKFSDETNQLHELTGIIKGITCDNELTDDEIFYLNKWLEENSNLAGNYPFDVITEAVTDILEDGVVTDEEREYLMKILSDFDDPIDAHSCSVQNSEITGCNIVLTGEFVSGQRSAMAKKLEALGAIIQSNVTKKTNLVIVGGYGSADWAHGNYGTKVKKALELMEKGVDVKIIKEGDCEWLK